MKGGNASTKKINARIMRRSKTDLRTINKKMTTSKAAVTKNTIIAMQSRLYRMRKNSMFGNFCGGKFGSPTNNVNKSRSWTVTEAVNGHDTPCTQMFTPIFPEVVKATFAKEAMNDFARIEEISTLDDVLRATRELLATEVGKITFGNEQTCPSQQSLGCFSSKGTAKQRLVETVWSPPIALKYLQVPTPMPDC
jgi:hypothetical protein